MQVLFYILITLFTIEATYNLFIKKDLVNASTYILFGVVLPLILYLFKWSKLITVDPTNEFYLILIYFFFFAIFFCLPSKKNKITSISIKTKNNFWITIFSFGYVILYLIENYIGSGTFFPALKGIDIHTYSAPLISYVTRNLFVFLIINIIAYFDTRERKYLLQFLIIFMIPFVTRSSRMAMIRALIAVLSFVIFYIINNSEIKENTKKRIKKNKKTIIKISVFTMILVVAMSKFTDYRTNQYGKINVYSYADSIKYTGPQLFSNILAYYYGYFPLSYNNLNINLKYNKFNCNYIGLYTFIGTYYGVLQLDNLYGLNPYQPSEDEIKLTGSATVATAFYNYYYDYEIFCFIPMIISFIIYIITRAKMNKSIYWLILFFFFTPNFLFYSFQNVFFTATTPYGVMLILIFCKLFIQEYKSIREEI